MDMSNNPLLHYKPGLTMDTPVAVELAAADWAVLMAWFANLPDETGGGVKHIVYGVIAEQVSDALYTQASIQAAKAHYHERFGLTPPGLRAEDAEDRNLPQCPACRRIMGMPTAPCLLCPDYGV